MDFSANHRYVQTLYVIMLQLHGSIIYFMSDNTVLMVWEGLGTKIHLVRVKSCFGLKYLILLPQTQHGKCLHIFFKPSWLGAMPPLFTSPPDMEAGRYSCDVNVHFTNPNMEHTNVNIFVVYNFNRHHFTWVTGLNWTSGNVLNLHSSLTG